MNARVFTSGSILLTFSSSERRFGRKCIAIEAMTLLKLTVGRIIAELSTVFNIGPDKFIAFI